jgi:hypothetical protein
MPVPLARIPSQVLRFKDATLKLEMVSWQVEQVSLNLKT